jgi:4-amino-4-deoxy-L-arabinose transferase-like glycosyltransferase
MINRIIKLKQVNHNIWFILIFIFASMFYLYNINFSDIWIDEAFTKALVRHSYGEITQLIKNDFHPPLYFFGLKLFVTIFGLNDFTLRLFSVLGILATILLVYIIGQKVFGKSGALYFCLLIISLPMLAEYAHEARMYIWGAFAVTGTFLFASRYISSNKQSDLLWCMLFSLLGAYTHYYALLAVFWANVFVSVYLFIRRKNQFKIHLIYSLIAFILYVPWFTVVLRQTKKVAESYWVPALNWQTFLSCLLSPFAPKIYLSPFLPLALIIYGLIFWVIYKNYIARKEKQGLVLGLSLCMFWCTILAAMIVSLLMQPVLYMRYLSNIIVLILIPVSLFFTSTKTNWIKGIVLAAILVFGIKISIDGSSFSFGPYQQSMNHIHEKCPEIRKVFHVIESSAGPFAECNNFDIQNYWYNPEATVVYTNMDVFDNLIQTYSLGKVLQKEEPFCLATFPLLPFNENNVKRILSESQLTRVDTVFDNKMTQGFYIILYLLKYEGVRR